MDHAERNAHHEEASSEVDLTLIDWYLRLSLVERLNAASRAAATLEALRDRIRAG